MQSGNFDYPPASPSSRSTDAPALPPRFPSASSTEVPSLPARFQRLRELLQTEREQEQASQRSSPSESPMPTEMDHSPQRRRRRRAMIRDYAIARASEQSQNSSPAPPPSQPPASALRTRPRAALSDRYLIRQRPQIRQTSYHTDALAGLQEAGQRLAEASSSISALLEQPISNPSLDLRSQEYSGDDFSRRRSKRRKLDNESSESGLRGFSYGHRGQVIPGPLRMEIASCDGGNYSEDSGRGRTYGAENVLKNDKSVYCTESNRCNLVLRHRGETAFCLEKIVIKAPERGFTAPVQEGMVFISMAADDLLARTAQYHISYGPSPASSSNRPRSRSQRRIVPPLSPENNTTSIFRPRSPGEVISLFDDDDFPDNDADDPVYDADGCDLSLTEPNDPARNIRTRTPPPFTVITECSDESADEEEETSAAVLADRHRRVWRLLGLTEGGDEEDDDVDVGPGSWRHGLTHTLGSPPSRRGGRRETPSRIEPLPRGSPVELIGDGDGRDLPDVMAPHARFFIKREKSMVSLKFDPPVSGRFILLKLWSPAREENIDIQSVTAYGFAGPRFFPAVEMR
ncbi:MAG: hypothetical protein M1819_007165 [Sarea resinae]|nr:MAG: hypothetical protein M1819_007165 [Sarea resinae]